MLNTELSPAFTNMTGANSFPSRNSSKKKQRKKSLLHARKYKYVKCANVFEV